MSIVIDARLSVLIRDWLDAEQRFVDQPGAELPDQPDRAFVRTSLTGQPTLVELVDANVECGPLTGQVHAQKHQATTLIALPGPVGIHAPVLSEAQLRLYGGGEVAVGRLDVPGFPGLVEVLDRGLRRAPSVVGRPVGQRD